MQETLRKKHILDRVLAIVALFGLLPVSFVVTVLLIPFWRWLEGNFRIEAIGHSGPAEWCYVLVYVVGALLAGFLLRFVRIVAFVLVLASVSIILFPLPHGGSLGEAFLHELMKSDRETGYRGPGASDSAELDRNGQSVARQSVQRFAGTLPFDEDFVRGTWRFGSVLGHPAWMDENTGMIWGERQNVRLSGWGQADLGTAMAWCATVEPYGYWSLPTNAEFALGVRDRMQAVIDDIAGRWITQSHVFESAVPFPSLVGFGGSNDNNVAHRPNAVSIRCIGRSEAAPPRGYFRKDISNEDAMRLLTRQ